MNKTAIGNELRKAGADTVTFENSGGHWRGIVVTAGGKQHGAGWDEGEHEAKAGVVVEYLKQWLAENR